MAADWLHGSDKGVQGDKVVPAGRGRQAARELTDRPLHDHYHPLPTEAATKLSTFKAYRGVHVRAAPGLTSKLRRSKVAQSTRGEAA